MLHYVLIDNSEGIDESEEQDIVGTTDLKSMQCITCRFYYFCTQNFRYEKNVCDGCYYCVIYENENKSMIFRILTIEKGTYRTVSSYFFIEIEILLEKNDLTNRKFSWLYKEELTSNENETKTDIEMN